MSDRSIENNALKVHSIESKFECICVKINSLTSYSNYTQIDLVPGHCRLHFIGKISDVAYENGQCGCKHQTLLTRGFESAELKFTRI